MHPRKNIPSLSDMRCTLINQWTSAFHWSTRCRSPTDASNQLLGSSRTRPRETKSGLERDLAWLLLNQSPWLSPSCHLLVILHELFFNWDPILPTCHSQLASLGPRWKVKFHSAHWPNTWNKFEAQWRQGDLQIRTLGLLSQERVSCDHLKMGFQLWRNSELLSHNGVFARDATQLVTKSTRAFKDNYEWLGPIGLLQGRCGNLQYTKTMRSFTWSSTWSQLSL